MKHMRFAWTIIRILVWAVGFVALAVTSLVLLPVYAQPAAGATNPMEILQVDAASFPVITATVSVRGAAQAQLDNLRLLEDGRVQDAGKTVSGGGPLDVAFLFDISNEAQDDMAAISRIVRELAMQLPDGTRYAFYEPAADGGNPRSVALSSNYPGPFLPDRNAVLNRLNTYTPSGPDATPLLEMVQFILGQFPADGSARHIVVFTGPVASSGANDVGIVQPACQAGSHVHAVLIAPVPEAAQNTTMLAELTGACAGANTVLTDAAAAGAIRGRMDQPDALVSLSYRTQQKEPRVITITAPNGSGGQMIASKELPAPRPMRVGVEILKPEVNSVFTATEPIELLARIQADPYPLEITRVEYSTDNGPYKPFAGSDGEIAAMLSRLPAGEHTLLVRATDELGNQGQATVDVVVAKFVPPPPPLDWRLIVALSGMLLSVAMGVLAVVLWKLPVGKTVLGAGPPLMLRMVLIEALPKAPDAIVLDKDTVVLGRDGAFASVVIEDDRISRKHCTIRRRNGRYTVQNNSGVNATLLNGQALEKDGHPAPLSPGAVLMLGPAKYRLESTGLTKPMGDVGVMRGSPPTIPMAGPTVWAKVQPANGQEANGLQVNGNPLTEKQDKVKQQGAGSGR